MSEDNFAHLRALASEMVLDVLGEEEEYAEAIIKKPPLEVIRLCMNDLEIVELPIKAYIVPYHDEHMNEFLSESGKRLKYISGFTGTAGTGIITQTETRLWTDARFFEKQLYEGWELMMSGLPSVPNETTWLKDNIPGGSLIGVDPKLVPYPIWNSLKDELKKYQLTLTPISVNLVDYAWGMDKPYVPFHKLIIIAEEQSGMKASRKLALVRSIMKEKNADMLIINGLDDIAWLLNLRGKDVPYNPLFFAFMAITKYNVHVFITEYLITDKIRNHFQREEIPLRLHPYQNFYAFVKEIVRSDKARINKVWIPSITSYEVYNSIPSEKHLLECSPIQILKSVKTDCEVEGMINAHIREGIALCRFFHWLETNDTITEYDAIVKLQSFQMSESLYIGPSLEPISASGPNASNPYYVANPEDSRPLSQDEIYLIQTGSHYHDGTTDISRTIILGTPNEFQIECFTRVLKGYMYLTNSIFPPGVKGNVLDCLARKYLWTIGLDYGHGTGHGIGCTLNSHEGPMGISWRPYPDDPGFNENMFLTIEPGYYNAEEENKFGIRLGNVVQIIKSIAPFKYQDKIFLKFRNITLCPISTKLIDIDLLTKPEIVIINDYHNVVQEILGPVLKHRGFTEVYDWLVKATAPLGVVPPPKAP